MVTKREILNVKEFFDFFCFSNRKKNNDIIIKQKQKEGKNFIERI